MEVGEPVAPPDLTDVKDECPFDHKELKPPEIQNALEGKGGTLATKMNNGESTNLYGEFKPSASAKVTWGKLPQKRAPAEHSFAKSRPDKGRCVKITFPDKNDATKTVDKMYPVSCSAHHLIPSQEALKGHELLTYMCKEGTSGENNHGFSEGAVWSDVGYDTNGSENGVYLPGNYAVGGGRGGLRVWYPTGGDDEEHDTGYIEPEKLPPAEYQGYEITGTRGSIHSDNNCWRYVAQSVRHAPGQFHDRHQPYSEEVVAQALTAIFLKYKKRDPILNEESCSECNDRQKKLKDLGLPAPYSVVKRLEFLSNKLRGFLTAGPKTWRLNIYTSEWGKKYMEAVRKGGDARKHAEIEG
jgi:hypothetical protein